MKSEINNNLQDRIEAIESGYEFLLAYAAQGHASDQDLGPDRNIRSYLNNINQALDDLGDISVAAVNMKHPDSLEACSGFFEALESDARKAQGAINLVLAQSSISSQLIDNLNASIHLRALLTDLFVLDEALKSR